MSYGDRVIDDMKRLVALFRPHCGDRSTLDEIAGLLEDRKTWAQGHSLFDKIREKTLVAEQHHDARAEAQYLFEEICAKTLYNLSNSRAPFDADSPYWIAPNAFALARALGIEQSEVVKIVAA